MKMFSLMFLVGAPLGAIDYVKSRLIPSGAQEPLLQVLLLSLLPQLATAEDSVAALMKRMQSDTAVSIAYQETRTLEMLDQPWQGNGYMYSLPPGLMIKEQLEPERVLMAIDGDKLFYYDPGNDVRHQGEMDEDDPLSLSIAVFKALMNADEQLLYTMYRVEFSEQPEQWRMTLKAKNDPESPFAIDIFGLPGEQVGRVKVMQADGDSSDVTLQKHAEGDKVKAKIDALYQELQGAED